MDVYIEKTKENKRLKFQGTAQDLLKKLGINKESVLVSRNNQLITSKEKLKDTDKLRILSVISGG
jgi:thiamine biosynthesis protein ThiS